MLIKKAPDILPSEITSESNYLDRRRLLASGALAATGMLLGCEAEGGDEIPPEFRRLENIASTSHGKELKPNSFDDIINYNNFYEFGTGKSDPARYSGDFEPQPWSVVVDGECDAGGEFGYEDLVSPHRLEERIYRMRCVEAWSMVIPWVGIPLADILKRFEPNSRAKYVAFETIVRPEQMPGQRRPILEWPYREGLTIAEAMHPLSFIAVGVYGVEMPNQNGAPMRLVVPWKYGFKGIKSIVRISFTETQPRTSWNEEAPHEYGFYANVNPEVDHPRWSQAREKLIGSGLFAKQVPTLMFNGYGEQVASLYDGLDLVRNY